MTTLIVHELCQRYGGDRIFFEVAYYWKFQKQVDLHGDLLAWRVQQIIPKYVQEFISHEYD